MEGFKRLVISFVILCSVSLPMNAQVQKGIVRTIGRPNDPGKPLPGVVIRMKGQVNSMVTDRDGAFYYRFNGKEGEPAQLLGVSKVGYELVDRSIIGKGMVLSSKVPWVIVMVSNEQLESDRNRISAVAQKKAEMEYQKKLEAINDALKQKRISTEEYKAQLEKLEHDYESYLFLIGTFADQYARTDYDSLDSLGIEIAQSMEEGNFDRADSLIHTRMDPDTVLERNHSAKAELQNKLEFLKAVLENAMKAKELLENSPSMELGH